MKNLPSRLGLVLGTLLAAVALPAAAPAATDTWTGSASGLWSGTGNWQDGVVPTTGDDVQLSALAFANSTPVAITLDSSVSVNGLTLLNSGTQTNQPYAIATSGGTTLTLGSGGITIQTGTNSQNHSGELQLNTGVILGADQTWTNGGATTQADINLNGNLSGTGRITKTGVGTLIFSGGDSSGWTGTGSLLTLNGGAVVLTGGTAAQLNRLGATLTMGNTSSTTLSFNNLNNSTSTFSTGIVFTPTGTGSFTITTGNSAGNSGQVIALTGNLSSTVALSQAITFNAALGVTDASVLKYKLSGDNSNLTSGITNGALIVQRGFLVADSANALGLNNGLSVSVGQVSTTSASNTGLLATSGHDVAGNIFVSANLGSATTTETVTLGLDGTGAVAFSGAVALNAANGAAIAPSNVVLQAGSGGKATFSGLIYDNGTGTKVGSVAVKGGGTVVLTHANTYSAPTSVLAGTTLLVGNASGSATGTGAVSVASGATLGGVGFVTGAVAAADQTSVFTAGRADLGTTGVLTLSGGLDASSGATFQFLVDGLSGSQFDFGSGALTLGGTDVFQFTNLGSVATGTAYTLFTGSGSWSLSGTPTFQFQAPSGYTLDSGYGGGSGYVWDAASHSLTVEFAAAPEPPQAALMALAAAGGLIALARRRAGMAR